MATSAIPAPHTIISRSGKIYHPLSRPSTAPRANKWMPTSTASRPSTSDSLERVPRNPRYECVPAKTNTGNNIKLQEHLAMTAAARYKRSEPFKRLKAEKLVEQMKFGCMKDVLLLDLREKSEFDHFHIQGSVNYPACMMSRSMYQYIPEILEYKNKEGKVMILVDVEEKLSVGVGTNWYEKGFENFAILTGGILAVAKAGEDLIEGHFPSVLLSPPKTKPPKSTPLKTKNGARDPTVSAGRSVAAGIPSAASHPLSTPQPARWTGPRQSNSFSEMSRGTFYTTSFDSNGRFT